MKKLRYLPLLLSTLLLMPPALAQGEADEPLPEAAETLLDTATPASAAVSEPVQGYHEWVEAFEKQFGQSIELAANGRVFYTGMATVSGDSAADAHYGSQLELAYQKAMFDMQSDFILRNYGRLKSKTIRSIYEDQSSNKDEFDPLDLQSAAEAGGSRLEALLDKALLYLDKKIDSELIEQGVPADQVGKMSVEQKKNTYKDNLGKEVIKSAYQGMQGLVPVQTRIFPVEENGKKTMAVAIIAVQSEKTRQFARDMSRKRPSLVRGSPKALADILPADGKAYLNEIGLRYTYDDSGRPMLISYGRTSVPMDPDWSASRAIRAKQNAQKVAQAMAEAGIVEFMKTNIRVSETANLADISEDWAQQITQIDNGKPGEVEQIREKIRETTQKFISSGTATASGDLRGTSVLKRWDEKDENGVVHVGTVIGWTYGQLDNAKAIDAQGRAQAGGAAASGAAGQATDQSRASRQINSKDDF